jgi:proline dehydrogenase
MRKNHGTRLYGFLTEEMMETYNKRKVVVYNTFQMYRKDRMDYLKRSFEKSQNRNYYLGAKIVRGAYMVKEGNRAKDEGQESPVFETKEESDKSFNQAIEFCVDHYDRISSAMLLIMQRVVCCKPN